MAVEKAAKPLFRESKHARRDSIPSGKVVPPCVRGVISDVHAAGNDRISFYSAVCGRRNSLQEGFLDRLRCPGGRLFIIRLGRGL